MGSTMTVPTSERNKYRGMVEYHRNGGYSFLTAIDDVVAVDDVVGVEFSDVDWFFEGDE